MNRDNSVYTVPFKVNGLHLSFILGTGVGDLTISMTEASFKLINGYLESSDFIGTERYIIAIGNIEEEFVINIKEVEISGLKLLMHFYFSLSEGKCSNLHKLVNVERANVRSVPLAVTKKKATLSAKCNDVSFI